MAYVTSNSTAARGNSIGDRVNAIIADYRAAAEKRRLFRRTLRELDSLSTRELNDLGLNPSMIKRIAWQSVYGQ